MIGIEPLPTLGTGPLHNQILGGAAQNRRSRPLLQSPHRGRRRRARHRQVAQPNAEARTGTITNELFCAAHEGRVTDGAAEPYEPWAHRAAEDALVVERLGLRLLVPARTIVGMLHPRHLQDHRTTWQPREAAGYRLAVHRLTALPTFANMLGPRGNRQPGTASGRSWSPTVSELVEGLSEGRAVGRVETDLPWKAAAGLPLTAEESGVLQVLPTFRQRSWHAGKHAVQTKNLAGS